MRIGFLHHPNDPYTEVRIKYFVKAGHQVWSIVNPGYAGQKDLQGATVITLKPHWLNNIPFGRRLSHASEISQLTADLKLDALYIVSALNSYYLKASNAKATFLEIQGSDVIYTPERVPFLKPFYRKYWKYAAGITQDSEQAKRKAENYLPKGVDNQTIEIGVDFSLFNPEVVKGKMREKFGLGNRPVVFHSRGIKPIYNLETIIRSVSLVAEKFPEVCYVFCGDESQLSDQGKKVLEESGSKDNIIFAGWVDHDSEMPAFIADSNVSVSMPLSDSSPFSVYEAMAMKTPVIVSDLPWLYDKFDPTKHLIKVETLDHQKLAEAIIGILAKRHSPNIDQAYDQVFQNINMESENRKLEAMINSALN